jgi:ubiquinone/menaquinone biosynthesis C-methylase UbiE
VVERFEFYGESASALGVQFHEDLASQWESGYLRGSFKSRLELFCAILDRRVAAGERWLDLGCGSGIITRELSRRGAIVTGVDGSPAMLSYAKSRPNPQNAPPITWVLADIQKLAWLDSASCDGILCSSVIEYMPDPSSFLEEISRVLRPGGTLILSIPPRGSVIRTAQKIFRVIFGIIGKDAYPYLSVSKFELSPKRVKNWLAEADFVVSRMGSFDPLMHDRAIIGLRPSLLIVEAYKDRSE